MKNCAILILVGSVAKYIYVSLCQWYAEFIDVNAGANTSSTTNIDKQCKCRQLAIGPKARCTSSLLDSNSSGKRSRS